MSKQIVILLVGADGRLTNGDEVPLNTKIDILLRLTGNAPREYEVMRSSMPSLAKTGEQITAETLSHRLDLLNKTS